MHTTDDRDRPMAQIRAGMRVVDQSGDDVGTVKLVRMGDPQAVTTEGQGGGGGLAETLAGVIGGTEPDVPAQFAAQLLRSGYLKIDCSGVLAGDAYVPADEVATVRDDIVHLSSDSDSLIQES
ncbi:hypothetical protein [Actinoplanes auranticolor]|nr:hypothetical protein [Actinoplanes auranticolor]